MIYIFLDNNWRIDVRLYFIQNFLIIYFLFHLHNILIIYLAFYRREKYPVDFHFRIYPADCPHNWQFTWKGNRAATNAINSQCACQTLSWLITLSLSCHHDHHACLCVIWRLLKTLYSRVCQSPSPAKRNWGVVMMVSSSFFLLNQRMMFGTLVLQIKCLNIVWSCYTLLVWSCCLMLPPTINVKDARKLRWRQTIILSNWKSTKSFIIQCSSQLEQPLIDIIKTWFLFIVIVILNLF